MGLVIKPTSILVIDSFINVSNRIVGTGVECSYEYISIVPSSLLIIRSWDYPSENRLHALTIDTAEPFVWDPSKLHKIIGSSLVSSIQPSPPFLSPYPTIGQNLCVSSGANESAVHEESNFY